MNKEEWISVGVKPFGVYLIVLAVIEVPIAITNIWQYARLMDMCNSEVQVTGTPEALEWGKTLCESIRAQSVKASLALIFYLVFGIYFIRSGKLVRNILCRENT